MNNFRGLLVAVIALAAVAGFTLGGVSFDAPAGVSGPTATSVDDNNSPASEPRSDESAVARSHGRDDSEAADDHWRKSPAHEPRDSDSGVSWSHGRDGSSANADEHWRKHGAEFSEDHNAREYEDEASNFVHSPPAGAEVKHRANGDTLIYDHDTNTFAVEDSHGNPRTMFKPDRGEAYWNRQH